MNIYLAAIIIVIGLFAIALYSILIFSGRLDDIEEQDMLDIKFEGNKDKEIEDINLFI